MATTKNHKITKTLKHAIAYAMNDKVEDSENVNLKDLSDSISYTVSDKTGTITFETLSSSINCGGEEPYTFFKETIDIWGKDEIRNGNAQTKNKEAVLAWHFHQNFEENFNPQVAHEIGRKLAEEMFPGFPVVIGTHTNTQHTHNHIIVCAWNMNGEKWNQCNANYRKLREVSDRLCDEYGLNVLEETRKQKFIKYKDEDGNVHYYEPTDRKNDLIRQRETGEIAPDDVGSYRNCISYEQTEAKKETNREIIRRDIDRLLPVATSYEDLLERLRKSGYIIKDKKKNGEYLKHIVFQPPLAEKGTRDNNISDDMFYIRENLERVIADFEADRAAAKQQSAEQTEPKKRKDWNGRKHQNRRRKHRRTLKIIFMVKL